MANRCAKLGNTAWWDWCTLIMIAHFVFFFFIDFLQMYKPQMLYSSNFYSTICYLKKLVEEDLDQFLSFGKGFALPINQYKIHSWKNAISWKKIPEWSYQVPTNALYIHQYIHQLIIHEKATQELICYHISWFTYIYRRLSNKTKYLILIPKVHPNMINKNLNKRFKISRP